MHIDTPRLTLIAATAAHLRADLAALASPPASIADHPLAAMLGVTMPEYWPPDLFEADDIERSLVDLAAHPDERGWGVWYLVEAGRLVGTIGLDGPPRDDGTVLLGYTLLPSARNRGLATEATCALVAWIFRDPRVREVAAETFPDLPASIRVLEKSGFARVGGAQTPRAIRFALRREMVRAVGLEPT